MGDGQHAWAAAEWVMMLRNMFVREEGDALILGSGIPAHWHYEKETIAYGPTLTPWGALRIEIAFSHEDARLTWHATWHRKPPIASISIPCFRAKDVDISASTGQVTLLAQHACGVPEAANVP